ncbi:MAG TPA: ATP synthase subunit C [Syntrophorhabdaceae bacterium]|nr:ATP synthase subunit C [Syntrophorhabdaceae bacterium]
MKLLPKTALTIMFLFVLAAMPLFAAYAQGAPSNEISSASKAIGLGVAAAFAIAVSVLGAGYAVGRIGSAALGAAAEKPELLTRSILFVALAEGLAVLGFAISMMLLQKI